MVPIPIWATTLMVQNETVYINIYMKLKNILSNLNRYFAVLIHYVYINYVYILYYIILYYIILYCIILYILYIYIYISRVFPTGGEGVILHTSQKFAHSPRTWNNFFPHQRLVPSPLNKNFLVINQQKLHF